MNQKNNLLVQVNLQALIRSILTGAAIGAFIIALFLISVDRPNPDWGSLWMMKPLIITPMAGGFAGFVFYGIHLVIAKGGWKNVAAFILSLIVCAVILWLGIVLGLNGTLWD